jgi:hypothetical protein
MADKNPSNNFQYGIKDIKIDSFFIDGALFNKDLDLKIEFNAAFERNIEADEFIFKLITIYYHEESTTERPIAKLVVANHFYIEDLKSRVSGDKTVFPDSLWVTMVSLSISHARAIMVLQLANTFLRDNIIPVVNPMDVAFTFFPEIKANHERAVAETKRKQVLTHRSKFHK